VRVVGRPEVIQLDEKSPTLDIQLKQHRTSGCETSGEAPVLVMCNRQFKIAGVRS